MNVAWLPSLFLYLEDQGHASLTWRYIVTRYYPQLEMVPIYIRVKLGRKNVQVWASKKSWAR